MYDINIIYLLICTYIFSKLLIFYLESFILYFFLLVINLTFLQNKFYLYFIFY